MRIVLLLLLPALAAAQGIKRRGDARWPTANHFRYAFETAAPAGFPLVAAFDAPAGLNRDSIRVVPDGGSAPLPAKSEWRVPALRVYWKSTGARRYHVYFDEGTAGETARLAEPAMIGAGDRLAFGRAGVVGPLAVGLWAHPAPLDIDGDGDIDLIVGCVDRPYNGTYLFRNIGTAAKPLFDRAEWLGPGKKDLVAADFNGDGRTDLVYSGGYFDDVRANLLRKPVSVTLQRDYFISRDDLWYPVDWDRDGRVDLLVGASDWRDYGWDDAFSPRGEWLRGPLHGFVWFHRNTGSNRVPRFEAPVKLQAAGAAIDLYGSPSPNPVDWFGRGRWDLIGGSFLDDVTLFENDGAGLRAGVPLTAGGRPIRLDLCMIQPRVVDWRPDRGPSLLVAEEDGTISLFENRAPRGARPDLAAEVKLQQIDPYLKSGALSRPVVFDWNGDGKLDIVAGNSAGYLQFFENTGTAASPEFADRGYLQAGGQPIRRVAGSNGSIQGPAEAKWGYSNPSIADWDLDGLPDILVNDILGEVVWHRSTGSRTAPQLALAQPVEVDWPGAPPKPEWNWKPVAGNQLVTQWRTTPKVVDWDRDGLPDLVMLNHQGYLCLFRRRREQGRLVLGAPERIFVTQTGRFLNLASGRAGASGRRKIEFADLDRDGDLDLVTDSNEGPVWYENTGSHARPVMQQRGTLVKAKLPGHNPTPNLADWNGDGTPDLLIGAEDGFFYYYDGRLFELKR